MSVKKLSREKNDFLGLYLHSPIFGKRLRHCCLKLNNFDKSAADDPVLNLKQKCCDQLNLWIDMCKIVKVF